MNIFYRVTEKAAHDGETNWNRIYVATLRGIIPTSIRLLDAIIIQGHV